MKPASLLPSVIALLVTSATLCSQTVVDWGGKSLPSEVTSANLRTASYQVADTSLTGTSVRRNWLYSSSTPLSPASNVYLPPVGKSSTFYGALQNIDSRGGYDYSRARISNNGVIDSLYLWGSEPGAGQSSKITGLIYFKKEDFLGETGDQPLSLASSSGFSMTGSMAGDTRRLRFAVLNDDVWYISNTSFGSGTSWSLGNAVEDNWAVWNPTGGELVDILNNSSLSFDVSGADFQNVQAVGFAYEISRGTNSPRMTVDSFTVNLTAIPEAGTVISFVLGGLPLLAAYRLFRK